MQAHCALSAVQGCKVHMQFGEARSLLRCLACLTGASMEFVHTGWIQLNISEGNTAAGALPFTLQRSVLCVHVITITCMPAAHM